MSIFEFILGVFLIWAIIRALMRQPKIRFEREYSQADPKFIPIKVEEVQGQVYLWNESSEEFLSQGKDFEEAMNKCVERFPKTKFLVKTA